MLHDGLGPGSAPVHAISSKTCQELTVCKTRAEIEASRDVQIAMSRDENVHMYAGYPIDPNLKGSGGHSRFIAQDPWRMS